MFYHWSNIDNKEILLCSLCILLGRTTLNMVFKFPQSLHPVAEGSFTTSFWPEFDDVLLNMNTTLCANFPF